MRAGDHAASIIGICCDAPKACKKLDMKKTIKPIKTPVNVITSVPLERGGRIDTVAASNIMAQNIKGWDSKLW